MSTLRDFRALPKNCFTSRRRLVRPVALAAFAGCISREEIRRLLN